MSDDLFGLGDNDIAEVDRRQREELGRRNPKNEPEVVLSMWTLARLTRDDKIVKTVVYGIVGKCLTDDYQVGDVVCSPPLLVTPRHHGRRIYVTPRLRFECKGAGNKITIREGDLSIGLPDPDADTDDINLQTERGEQ
jgi:hypothetical protein